MRFVWYLFKNLKLQALPAAKRKDADGFVTLNPLNGHWRPSAFESYDVSRRDVFFHNLFAPLLYIRNLIRAATEIFCLFDD